MVARWLSELSESYLHIVKSKEMNQRGDQRGSKRERESFFSSHYTFIKEDLEEIPYETSLHIQMSKHK